MFGFKKILIPALLLSKLVAGFGANLECRFIGYGQDHTIKIDETVPFSLNSDEGGSGYIGPYKVEIMVYEGNFQIGVELNQEALSSISISKPKVLAMPPGTSVFGVQRIAHDLTNSVDMIAYSCIKIN